MSMRDEEIREIPDLTARYMAGPEVPLGVFPTSFLHVRLPVQLFRGRDETTSSAAWLHCLQIPFHQNRIDGYLYSTRHLGDPHKRASAALGVIFFYDKGYHQCVCHSLEKKKSNTYRNTTRYITLSPPESRKNSNKPERRRRLEGVSGMQRKSKDPSRCDESESPEEYQ
ncbi:hypothetical protein ARMSODRAFT_671743 [Armillaria solidipes]|uniref:Uncharacterized protein n=1 Tax=Armillaria solidipes TaxID=1076256 RepID=A0A2H3B9B3_9AGAR|nr:hypothetical protein ARMSODRAFT_671743 [Armillaria solidipes]